MLITTTGPPSKRLAKSAGQEHQPDLPSGLKADAKRTSAAIPVARYVEYLTPCAYIDELAADPFRLDRKACWPPPRPPGLGIEIEPDRLKRFCPERIEFR